MILVALFGVCVVVKHIYYLWNVESFRAKYGIKNIKPIEISEWMEFYN